MTNKRKTKSTEFNACLSEGNDADFLPLEDGLARNIPKAEEVDNKATVLYIGRIPHGFYEDEMEGFFKQFGTIKRLKIARNIKVAKIVADCMQNYLLFEHMLQVHLLPPEHVHPKLWRGVNRRYKPVVDFVQIERKKHNKDRTLEEHQKLVITILKRDTKRRKKLEAAGVEYECPSIEGANQPVRKKIRFD